MKHYLTVDVLVCSSGCGLHWRSNMLWKKVFFNNCMYAIYDEAEIVFSASCRHGVKCILYLVFLLFGCLGCVLFICPVPHFVVPFFFYFLLVPWLCPGVLLVYQPMCIYTPVSYVLWSCQCMASVGMLSFVSCIPCFSGIVEFILYFHLVLINLLHLDPAQFAYFTHRCTFTHQNENKAYF